MEPITTSKKLAETCARVERLKQLLGPEAPTLSALARKFSLGHPAVSTVIPGMRKVSQAEANTAAADLPPLPAEKLRALKEHAWPRNFYAGAWE